MSEIYLWHMHSLLPVFHTHIQIVEKASNAVVEVLSSLESIYKTPEERKHYRQNLLLRILIKTDSHLNKTARPLSIRLDRKSCCIFCHGILGLYILNLVDQHLLSLY